MKIPQNSSPMTMSSLGLSTNPSTINSSYEILPEESANNRSKPVSAAEHQAVPILYYHSVMLEVGNEIRMPPDQFEAQMAYLKDKGYQSVSLDQLYQAQYRGGTLPPKPFVITFDDGYADNYTTAFPILKKYGFTATIFMVSSYINGEDFMSWPQLKELAANGWDIEGHTVNHPYLSKQDATTVLSELRSSKELLERELERPVEFFAYPYGDYNTPVVLAVRNTGYLMAVTTERGWANHNTDSWHVHRVYCYANMGLNEFSRRLHNPNY
ncbi:polysaccharide deacetylase family protein [Desulfosporosinus metallidurans]|uniref:Polysaccharide deacetylase n=1 Tax=Desulfosporosinus metallidurans TaxID=1888891 RepID=A0A1Q8QYA3_9FIRM|nr:polysaccharide deacetylase family protein [Desulfosporosinus metallidurans]OLN32285.1 Polysaccharide deacetylase [Desulfosporosinus metallidurans]